MELVQNVSKEKVPGDNHDVIATEDINENI